MKRVVLMLMMVAMLGTLAQADLVLTGGNLYADAQNSNTTFADGTSPAMDPSTTAGLWKTRAGGWGYNAAGEYTGTGSDIQQALVAGHYTATGVVDDLLTTVTGLVDGQEYNVYVVYSSVSAGQNWHQTASLSPITRDVDGTATSGVTYGAADTAWVPTGSTTGNVLNIMAGTIVDAGSYPGMIGLVGTVTGDATGELGVYVGLGSHLSDQNTRAWYDGVYLQAVPEPATMAILGLGALLIRRKR